jgi:hypothetical protein
MTAQVEKAIKLVTFETRAGDAFAGNLLDLLSASKDRQTIRQAFNIVFASHVIYHADAYSDVQRILTDVADNPMWPTISSPATVFASCTTLPTRRELFRSSERVSEAAQALWLTATRQRSRSTIHPRRSESRAVANVYLFMKPLLGPPLASDRCEMMNGELLLIRAPMIGSLELIQRPTKT